MLAICTAVSRTPSERILGYTKIDPGRVPTPGSNGVAVGVEVSVDDGVGVGVEVEVGVGVNSNGKNGEPVSRNSISRSTRQTWVSSFTSQS